MTVKECINCKTEGLDWKVVCNSVILITNKSCVFVDRNKLDEIEQKEVVTCLRGLNDLTIVVL